MRTQLSSCGGPFPQVNSIRGLRIVGLKGIDIAMILGVLGHSIDEEPEARLRSASQGEGPAVIWDLEEEGPAFTMSVEACFIKFKHVNVGMIHNLCHLHSSSVS